MGGYGMSLTGDFKDICLAEVFQLFERGRKTGLLTLQVPSSQGLMRRHFVWFYDGRIIAAADRLDHRRLEKLLYRGSNAGEFGGLGERVLAKMPQLCPEGTPLGLWLQNQGLLRPDQVRQLFHRQVVCAVSRLVTKPSGQFEFHPQRSLPWMEMTGLSITPMEVVLLGLRRLKLDIHWLAKLPQSESVWVPLRDQPVSLKLTQSERLIYRCLDGSISLETLAQQVRQPILEVQKIILRLQLIGAVHLAATPRDFSAGLHNQLLGSWRGQGLVAGPSSARRFESVIESLREAAPRFQGFVGRLKPSA